MILQENMVVADRFRLVRMIGRGGMGSVWQAMHLGLDTPCALKFIEGELSNVAEAHARFEREAKAAAQLRSPHVVQIFDHGVWQGRPYIAMELLDGVNLGERLNERGGRLEKSEVHVVVQQVCRALTKAHNAGVVHRDLKPDNIFLVRDDDRELVKILDFGVAKSTAQAIDGSNTKTGAMLGTPYYMSPEQAQGIKSVDSKSDLWSLAVIVFQCLTGRLPFESEALGDLLVKIIVNPIPVPSQISPHVPPGFDRWWLKAADRNPENRFLTAKEFSDSLALALGQSAITDQHDRAALMRMAGGTAVMQQNPGTYPPVGAQTSPAAQTAMAPANSATPNPAGPSPNQGFTQPNPPMLRTPQPNGHPQQPPHMATPQPNTGGFGQQLVGTGATFSGVEPPVAIPGKKGPPLALFAGLGALLLVGLVIGGVAIMKGKGSTTTGSSSGEPTASMTAAPEASSAPIAKTAEPPPTQPTATETAPTATVAGNGTTGPGGNTAPTGPTGHAPKPIANNKPVPTPPTTPSAKPTTTATATAAATTSGKKPYDPGF